MITADVGLGAGVAVAAGAVGAGIAEATAGELLGVVNAAPRVGRGAVWVCEVALGVVLIASGCPQLVSRNSNNTSLT